ncbi:hypothetical protein RFI_23723 [Reticulomyxa filosa]|uniref:Uncharacterized protein n=1 Tax=Reticulomyxa filosa TaxID=46433 RepID=X6MIY9_RETFI|nr:hypothetical protein RFI_23723 [Reticulomyxa filosa]|eukprot:ETO13641.1 hypothetical protein RFI_23723 [Reticulomyxa filosa]
MQSHPGHIKPRVETSLGKSNSSAQPTSRFNKNASAEERNRQDQTNSEQTNTNTAATSSSSMSEDENAASPVKATVSSPSQERKISRKLDPSYNPMNDPELNVVNPLQMTLDQTFFGMTRTSDLSDTSNVVSSPTTTSRQFSEEKENIPVNLLDHCNVESLLAQMKHGTLCLQSFEHAIKVFSKEQIKHCDETLKLLNKSKLEFKVQTFCWFV